jgi:hypothetical protein
MEGSNALSNAIDESNELMEPALAPESAGSVAFDTKAKSEGGTSDGEPLLAAEPSMPVGDASHEHRKPVLPTEILGEILEWLFVPSLDAFKMLMARPKRDTLNFMLACREFAEIGLPKV